MMFGSALQQEDAILFIVSDSLKLKIAFTVTVSFFVFFLLFAF